MATKPKKTSSKPAKTATPKPAEKKSRPAPTKVYRPQIAPHPKTLSNGQPRPKTRRG